MAELSENTAITIPIRNIVGMMVVTVVSTMAYFSVQERLNNLEHSLDLAMIEQSQNTEFRIKWPRGELGALPADARQDMLIEYSTKQQEKQTEITESVREEIHDLKLRIAALEKDVDIE